MSIENFAQSLVKSMSASEIQAFDRQTFIVQFSHPDFKSYSDFLELVEAIDTAIAMARQPAMRKARKVA